MTIIVITSATNDHVGLLIINVRPIIKYYASQSQHSDRRQKLFSLHLISIMLRVSNDDVNIYTLAINIKSRTEDMLFIMEIKSRHKMLLLNTLY